MIRLLAPYPAALVRSQGSRTVVVADLHIGWEVALSQEGIHVPSQTHKLLKKLVDVVSKYKADRLLILGDVKHTVASAETLEWRDIPDFFTALGRRVNETLVVRGNHDGNIEPLLPESVKVLPSTGIALGPVGFFHGHRWPSPALLNCKTLVMGHVHPVVVFRDSAGFRVTRQVWVKADCDAELLGRVVRRKCRVKNMKDDEVKNLQGQLETGVKKCNLFIMPSFNDFLGGRPLNEGREGFGSGRTVGPVLRSKAVDLKNAEIYLLDGTFLGTLEQLKTLG
jgi:putative SbcD/Mre11-related phosphoesterase